MVGKKVKKTTKKKESKPKVLTISGKRKTAIFSSPRTFTLFIFTLAFSEKENAPRVIL